MEYPGSAWVRRVLAHLRPQGSPSMDVKQTEISEVTVYLDGLTARLSALEDEAKIRGELADRPCKGG